MTDIYSSCHMLKPNTRVSYNSYFFILCMMEKFMSFKINFFFFDFFENENENLRSIV